MQQQRRPEATLKDATPVEAAEGIVRRTLAYSPSQMLCHFSTNAGATIDLHNHEAAQIGYLISGKVRFFKESGDSFIAEAGSSWAFTPWEKHGAEFLENSEIVEVFSPLRPEYVS
jgi:quercetin dioxygenase-like cupin family protein